MFRHLMDCRSPFAASVGRTLLLGFFLPLSFASGRAQSPATTEVPAVSSREDRVGAIVLRDESIDQVLVLLERWTGKTVLRPQALPTATITLTLQGETTREEAVRALETLLTLNGVAVTPLDARFLKVTPLANAKSETPELIAGSTLGLPASGRIASKVFQLSFLQVNEVMPQIAPLLSPGAASPPVVFEKANAALVTDTLANLQRIETLLVRLDQPILNGLQPKFYSLHFAKASEVVNKMRTILSGPLQSQLGSATTYNPDDRTNQIVLVTDARQQAFFDELIARLDVKSDPNTRNEVLYLKHAAAKDVASILSLLVTGQNKSASTEARPVATAAATPPATVTAPATTPASAPAASTPALPVNLTVALEPSSQFSPLLTILPEERSNSIVVSGTVDDIRLINELVAKIDVLLAQVRIEVVIAEVTLSDNATTGIDALQLKVSGDKLVGGALGALDSGLSLTDVTVTRPGTTGPYDLAGIITLATTPRKDNATILSQPTIITTHNKVGKIFVGETRPVISSYLNDTATTGTGGAGYRSTVGQQKIGIDLAVKPLIGTDGSVQLEIQQKVEDVIGEIVIDGNPQPRVGVRTTESFVSVRSGEIIVLGGLQRGARTKSTSRLGPIPLIGDLLGSRSHKEERTDLVFFLRPTVLTNTPADNAAALEQIEKLPPKTREDIHQAIAPPVTASRP